MSDNVVNLAVLADEVAVKAEIPVTVAIIAIKTLLDSIGNHVAVGEKVSLPQFGVFSKTHRAERKGRNPHTGAVIDIMAKSVPTFRAAKRLKDRVNV